MVDLVFREDSDFFVMVKEVAHHSMLTVDHLHPAVAVRYR